MNNDSPVICADCGATCKPDGVGTGYGETAGGDRVCYSCCGERGKKDMIKTGRWIGYLSGWELTNWPGSLRFKVMSMSKGRHNIGRQRVDVWFTGPDGDRWWGVNIGDSQITHCRRVKGKR